MKLLAGPVLWGLVVQQAVSWADSDLDAFLSGIQTVDYNARSYPDASKPEVFDSLLADWKGQIKRFTPQVSSLCPVACSDAGPDPAAWTLYSNMDRLRACNETLVFDFAIFTKINNGQSKTSVRACTADFGEGSPSTKRDDESEFSAESAPVFEERITVPLQFVSEGSIRSNAIDVASVDGVVAAGRQISDYLSNMKSASGNKPTVAFTSSGPAVMVLYAGHQVRQQRIQDTVLDKFLKQVEEKGISDSLVVEICDEKAERGADYVLGIAASTKGDIPFLQDAAARWANGTCLTEAGRTSVLTDVSLNVPDVSSAPRPSSSSAAKMFKKRADGECEVRQVAPRDSCGALAAKCGITPAEFTKYNDYDPDLCSTLVPGQYVCCSKGKLPDMRPKPDDDGNCFAYTTKDNDDCSSIAAANSLKPKDLEEFNKKTWSWAGCDSLWSGINICLSKGYPPMPAEVPNAVCGPTVPGTKKPTNGKDLADLNQCLLNACCNIWGQCGVTAEFCTESESESGAPGTAAPGENGCVSNCGVEIVKSDPPAERMTIGYFEAWNGNRDCLNMRASQIPEYMYTHIHFAFPNVTEDFKIDASEFQDEFDLFKKLDGVKKIVSLGGWAFSNEPGTVHILREAVKLDNQAAFRKGIIDFLNEHELDGIDIDWEYPEAMDIPGTPPGSDVEGELYAIFLATLKAEMPKGKTVSFAAPSSFWYLKSYPIKAMAPSVDYIVHMTYDLHGQWDYDNPHTSPGCPTGNCLRSHVNLTETFTSLSMITKAGMPSNKVAVGVTSYGRSFNMAEPGCYDEMCKFTGTPLKSDATPGDCTGEPGYIADAEIAAVAETSHTWSKTELLSDFLVYDDTQWVAYMSTENKNLRRQIYDSYHMAGSSDWAIDLQSFHYDDFYDEDYTVTPLSECKGSYDSVEAVDKDKANIPGHCIEGYIVGALSKTLQGALDDYDDIMADDYDTKFGYFARAVREQWAANMGEFFNKHIPKYFDCYRRDHNDDLVDHDCPPFDKSPGLHVEIVLKMKDKEGFEKFILKEYDIDYENIEFVTRTDSDMDEGPGCNLGPCGLYFMEGVPSIKRDPNVPNPKDAVSKSLKNLRKLPDYYAQTASDMNYHLLDSQTTNEDIVDGAMVPVFMVVSATESMQEVAEIGEELQEAERKFIIGMIVTAILFIVPAAGQALSSITGIAMIGRIAAIAAEIGGGVAGAIDIAENDDNLAAGIFGIILGFVGVGSAAKGLWKDAASFRRSMRASDLVKLGPTVKNNVDLVDSMVKVCRLKK